MNKLILLFISLSLISCTNSTDTSDDSPVIFYDESPALDQDLQAVPAICDRVETHTIIVNGSTLKFNIPALCTPYLKLDRGDPPDSIKEPNVNILPYPVIFNRE